MAKCWKRKLITDVIRTKGGLIPRTTEEKSVTQLGRLIAFGEYIERRDSKRAARKAIAIKVGVGLAATSIAVIALYIFL